MREIKFRAWDKVDKVMITWWEILNHYNINEFLDPASSHYSRYIVMQYTGVKDINGTEIYEGDIVKETLKLERGKKQESFYEVNFGNGMFRYKQPLVYGYEYLEVVGNIYENPELIL